MQAWTRRCTKGLLLLAALLGLYACQSAPVRTDKGFSPAQVAVLRAQGFHQTAAGWQFDSNDKVLFGLNVGTLSDSGRALVTGIGKALLGVGIDKLQLDGFADNTGTHDYNVQLSVRRAQAVADALAEAGMQRRSLVVTGLGESDPVASNQSAEGRAQNRRVAIIAASP